MRDAALGGEADAVAGIDFVGLGTGAGGQLVAADGLAVDVGDGAVGLVVCGSADVLPGRRLMGGGVSFWVGMVGRGRMAYWIWDKWRMYACMDMGSKRNRKRQNIPLYHQQREPGRYNALTPQRRAEKQGGTSSCLRNFNTNSSSDNEEDRP